MTLSVSELPTVSLIQQLAQLFLSKKLKLVLAESCTGGGIAKVVTDLAGSSQWFERGYVVYSNIAKEECLGVKHETIEHYGAVSEQCTCEMALGALEHSHAQIALSVTGIAGPDGGSAAKPVGTVWFGLAGLHIPIQTKLQLFQGDRLAIRDQAIQFALEWLVQYLKS